MNPSAQITAAESKLDAALVAYSRSSNAGRDTARLAVARAEEALNAAKSSAAFHALYAR